MRRKVCLILAMLCFLTACAETPKEKIVVNKSEGLPSETIIPADNNTAKDLEVPDYWKGTIEKSDGYVKVTADYEMNIPEIYNTPVYSYELIPMTREMLENLCRYFVGDKEFYKVPSMTKDELKKEKEKFDHRKGGWGRYYGTSVNANMRYEMAERWEEMIAQAPETQEERKYVNLEFTSPEQLEIEYLKELSPYIRQRYSKYYYDTDKKIGFTAKVETEEKNDPVIRAVVYDKTIGSTSNFLYNQGIFIDERELEYLDENNKIYKEASDQYISFLKDLMMDTEDGSLSKEDALNETKKVLKDLSLEEFEVTDCVKAVGTLDSESWGGIDETDNICTAYSIYLSKKTGELTAYDQTGGAPSDGLAEKTYAPSFFSEKIHLTISSKGIHQFEWTDFAQYKDTIAENTRLLPFKEIADRAAAHLLYDTISRMGENDKASGSRWVYEVKNVQLRMGNINAYEDPSAVWMVPVWVFDFYTIWDGESGESKVTSSITVVINAIDGGYVNPKVDSRIGV